MKKFISVLILLIFAPIFAQSSMVSYNAVEKFHQSKIDMIIEEYNLQDRMKISVSLSPLSGEKKVDQQIIKLPGLFLDAVALNVVKKEVGLVEIIDALKEYKRKVVFLRSSKVSDNELQVVQKAVQEELFVKSTKSFVVKDWTANTGYQKFKSSLYSGVIMSPKAYMAIFAFIVVAFLIFTLAKSILDGFKHVGKSIYDGVEKSFSANQQALSGMPQGMEGLDDSSEKDSEKDGKEEAATKETIEEYNEVEIDCLNILKLISSVHSQRPNELGFRMWDFFPDLEDQLNFYVTFESQLEDHEMLEFRELFNSMFNVEKTMGEHVELKPKAFNASQVLWSLQVALTHMSVKPVDSETENLFSLFIKDYRGQIDQIIDKSIDSHYKFLNCLFPERVLKKVQGKSKIDEALSKQILSFMTLDNDNRFPTDLEIKLFKDHLVENNYFVDKNADEKNAVELDMLSRLPDHILFSEGEFGSDKMIELNVKIPNFNWLKSADGAVHKQFILSLTPNEAAYFVENYKGYNEFKHDLDTRTLSRLQEFKVNANNVESTQVILGVRKKIKYFYKPVDMEKADEVIQAA